MHKKWRKKFLRHKNTQAEKRSLIALTRKKFQTQEVQNPICKKPQEVLPQTANTHKKFTVVGLISNRQI